MLAQLKADFSTAMTRLGPFGASPRLAVAVSGGADSTALALLTQDWLTKQHGDILALIVDHGLRAESSAEAAITQARLQARDIPARVLTLTGLDGRKLQETARQARYAALTAAAREAGFLFLLLGHQAADQSETVFMRAGRGPHGLEGMAEWTARTDNVLVRPLLGVPPTHLRDYLRKEKMAWIEDPSNQNLRFERVRIRLAGNRAVPQAPAERRLKEAQVAAFLAQHAVIWPEGFAVVLTESLPCDALSALLRVIGGKPHAPRREAIARLANKLHATTLGGVCITSSRRFGKGWILCREQAACGAPVPAELKAMWDNRFCLLEAALPGMFGTVSGGPSVDCLSDLPAKVKRTLPHIKREATSPIAELARVQFLPPAPATALLFTAPDAPNMD